ncbi:MAG: 50S ribosomal protein L1 [Candidatus Pacearchaeota archaeon]
MAIDKQAVLNGLKELREKSPKRNFKQTIDLVITLKDLDLKKPEQQVDLFLNLHYNRGKKIKVCALVGPELFDQAKEVCDKAIVQDQFDFYAKDKKAVKKLADEFDFFIAQATIMPKIATVFGKVLGPKNKMPNPRAGCVVPPNANLKPLYERLQKTVRVMAKTQLMAQLMVGKEEMKDEEIADNIMVIYDALKHALPESENNIKAVFIKFTMSKPVKIG